MGWIDDHRVSWITSFTKALLHVNETHWVLALIGLAAAAVVVWRRAWRVGISTVWAVLTAGWISGVLKEHFERPRPQFPDALVQVDGWAMPSNHSSVLAAGCITFVCAVAWSSRQGPGLGVCGARSRHAGDRRCDGLSRCALAHRRARGVGARRRDRGCVRVRVQATRLRGLTAGHNGAMRLIDLLPTGTTNDEDAVYDAIAQWVESRGLTLYPGAGRGDPRVRRRLERHPRDADRLGQEPRGDRGDGRGAGAR